MKAFISILILFVSWSLSMGAVTATYTDGVTQIFNPSNTRAGMNVGSITGDPGTVNNGDVWYATSDHTIRLRINGATEALATKEWVITQGYGNAQSDEVVFLDGSTPMTGLLSFTGTTHPGIRLNQLTTTQQDAMTPLSGYFIGNTTTGLPSYYNGSAWVTIGGGSNRIIADLSTVYSAPTWTLVSGTDYYGTANGARTIAFPASPTEGDSINIFKLVVTSGPVTLTIPSSYRTGTTSVSTSVQLPTGNHQISFKYGNATWQLTDTGVDNEIAKSIFGNTSGSAGLPSFTSDPVVTTMTVDTEAYDATNWDGDLTVPTKDAVRDKINSMSSAGQLIHVFSGNASGSATAWTSMPAAQTFLWGSSGGRSTTTKIDLTNYSQVRFMVNKTTTTAGVAGSILSLKYNTTYSTSDTGYSTIGTSAVQVAIDVSTGYLDTGWIDLAAGAKADVFVTVTGTGGNGSTSPSFGNIVAQFK